MKVVQIPRERGVFAVDLERIESLVTAGVTRRLEGRERSVRETREKCSGIVNAHLEYRFGRWATTVYAQNLTEENYYQFINPEIYAGSPGAPRRYGVQLSFEY